MNNCIPPNVKQFLQADIELYLEVFRDVFHLLGFLQVCSLF